MYRFILLLLIPASLFAQQPKALPEVTFIPPAKEHYVWEKAGQIKGTRMFGNTIAVVDSVVYSFGGYTPRDSNGMWLAMRGLVHREMNVLSNGRLIRDSIEYPGTGFFYNLFFHNKGSLFIGGGRDSGATLYAWSDFWRYDLQSRSWSKLRDIPFNYAHPLYVYPNDSGAFVLTAVMKKVENERFRDATPALLQYNASKDSWLLKGEIPEETGLSSAPPQGYVWTGIEPVSFRIVNDLYVLLLRTCGMGASCPTTFFKVSLIDGRWTRMPPFPGTIKAFCFGLSDGTFGFIGGGLSNFAANSRVVYRFDPRREEWTRIENLPNGLRRAVGWNFKGENYVGFGLTDDMNRIVIYKLKEKNGKGKKAGR